MGLEERQARPDRQNRRHQQARPQSQGHRRPAAAPETPRAGPGILRRPAPALHHRITRISRLTYALLSNLTLTLGEAAELSGNCHVDEERARGSDEHRRVRQTFAALREGVAAL